MGRWQRSRDLAEASWRTLRADREPRTLPVLSFGASLVLAAVCIGVGAIPRAFAGTDLPCAFQPK